MQVNSNEDVKDFIDLYKKFYPKIYNYISRKFIDKTTAEDITSNTFLKAFDYINKKNPEIKNFNAWIYKIATNEVNMHLRYHKDKKNISIDDENLNLANILQSDNGKGGEKFIDYLAVKKALLELKPVEQSVIEMHFFERLDYSDISEVLGIKENSLRSILHRSLKKIENLLG